MNTPDVNKVIRRLRYAQWKLDRMRRFTAHWSKPMRRVSCHDEEQAVCKLLDELWGAQHRAAISQHVLHDWHGIPHWRISEWLTEPR